MADVRPYPLTLVGDLSDPPSRWLWIFKGLLAIPHFIILSVLILVVGIVTFLAWWAILFTSKYPRSLFDFVAGFWRWGWRVSFFSYGMLGTDKYPPFSLEKAAYPADFDIVYPEKLSRGLIFVKWLLAFPHYVILWALSAVLRVLIFVCAIMLLFTGKYPEELFKFNLGINRWMYRVIAYVSLMTDEYPPFSLD